MSIREMGESKNMSFILADKYNLVCTWFDHFAGDRIMVSIDLNSMFVELLRFHGGIDRFPFRKPGDLRAALREISIRQKGERYDNRWRIDQSFTVDSHFCTGRLSVFTFVRS
jgi:hypothetical protein